MRSTETLWNAIASLHRRARAALGRLPAIHLGEPGSSIFATQDRMASSFTVRSWQGPEGDRRPRPHIQRRAGFRGRDVKCSAAKMERFVLADIVAVPGFQTSKCDRR